MIDTDVEQGSFWPARDKVIKLSLPDGRIDYKFLFPLLEDDLMQLYIIHRFARKHGWLEKPDSEFAKQVKEKLGISIEAE